VQCGNKSFSRLTRLLLSLVKLRSLEDDVFSYDIMLIKPFHDRVVFRRIVVRQLETRKYIFCGVAHTVEQHRYLTRFRFSAEVGRSTESFEPLFPRRPFCRVETELFRAR
jgi:hypothetical protein